MVQFVTANPPGKYETVAASQTDQVMGPVGATGDFLEYIHVFAAASAGTVVVKDGSTTIATLTVPSSAVTSVPFRIYSTSGAWKITTGANLTVVATGAFS